MHNSTQKKYSIFDALQPVVKETSPGELAKLILDPTSAIYNALLIDTAGDKKEMEQIAEVSSSMRITQNTSTRSRRVIRNQ